MGVHLKNNCFSCILMTELEDETEETEEEMEEEEEEAEAEVSRFKEDLSRQRVYPSGKAGRKEGRRGVG